MAFRSAMSRRAKFGLEQVSEARLTNIRSDVSGLSSPVLEGPSRELNDGTYECVLLKSWCSVNLGWLSI